MPISINQQIKENAVSWKEWRHHDKAKEAYELFDKVSTVLFKGEAPQPVVGFDDTVKEEGFYHWEGDNVSLSFHVDLPHNLTRLQLVIAGIHNTVHVNNETLYTKVTWYHKKAFQDSMAEFGIDVANDGSTVSLRPEFVDTLRLLGEGELAEKLLADFGAKTPPAMVEPAPTITTTLGELPPIPELETSETPDTSEEPEIIVGIDVEIVDTLKLLADFEAKPVDSIPMPVTPSPQPTGKMKKWSCLCTNVRCATELRSMCYMCHYDFSLQS